MGKKIDRIRVRLARSKVRKWAKSNQALILRKILKKHPELKELIEFYRRESFGDNSKI